MVVLPIAERFRIGKIGIQTDKAVGTDVLMPIGTTLRAIGDLTIAQHGLYDFQRVVFRLQLMVAKHTVDRQTVFVIHQRADQFGRADVIVAKVAAVDDEIHLF